MGSGGQPYLAVSRIYTWLCTQVSSWLPQRAIYGARTNPGQLYTRWTPYPLNFLQTPDLALLYMLMKLYPVCQSCFFVHCCLSQKATHRKIWKDEQRLSWKFVSGPSPWFCKMSQIPKNMGMEILKWGLFPRWNDSGSVEKFPSLEQDGDPSCWNSEFWAVLALVLGNSILLDLLMQFLRAKSLLSQDTTTTNPTTQRWAGSDFLLSFLLSLFYLKLDSCSLRVNTGCLLSISICSVWQHGTL